MVSRVASIRLAGSLAAMRKGRNKLILFYCNTPYHLFNAIHVKKNVLKPDVEADIMISDLIDLQAYIEPLSRCGLFRKVIALSDRDLVRGFNQLKEPEKTKIYKSASKFMAHIQVTQDYTGLYCFYVDPYLKALYYLLIQEGLRPAVHLIEDGLSSYVVDFSESQDVVNRHYKKKALTNNISEMLLYEPEFCLVAERYPVYSLEKIKKHDSGLKTIYQDVFGSLPLPQEKFIFFEEAFLDNYHLASDLIMVKELAGLVGKENITIKPHPRNSPDRWLRQGLKVMTRSKTPWEVSVLFNGLADKVLLTASSAAPLNSSIVFEIQAPTFLLYKLMQIGNSVQVRQRGFHDFVDRAMEKYNKERVELFAPNNQQVMLEQLKYIKAWSQ